MAIDRKVIEEIKSSVSLEEVVSQFVVLKNRGNRVAGKCPFHGDSEPSFYIYGEDSLYYCFGCLAAGDVIDFYQAIYGLEFVEAIQCIGKDYGIEVPAGQPAEQGSPVADILEVLRCAGDYFRSVLKDSQISPEASRYLEDRGIAHDLAEHFELGASSSGFNGLYRHLVSKGFTSETIFQAGLARKTQDGSKTYDFFRNRIVFPVHDVFGRIVAFGGRSIGNDGKQGVKYLNTAQSLVFSKSEQLYGVYQAKRAIRSSSAVIVTEGYTDVITFHSFGFKNTVGVLGTAMTPKQVRRLSGLAETACLVFDGDEAGINAARESAAKVVAAGMDCRVILLPEGEDADSVLRSRGINGMRSLFASAEDGLGFICRHASGYSPARRVKWAVDFLSLVDKPAVRSVLISEVAMNLGVSGDELRKQAMAARHANRKKVENVSSSSPEMTLLERQILEFAATMPEKIEEMSDEGVEEVFETEVGKQLWQKIASRNDDPMRLFTKKEKDFYVRARIFGHETRETGGWPAIKRHIRQTRKSRRQSELLQMIYNAEKKGEDPSNFLRELNDLCVTK